MLNKEQLREARLRALETKGVAAGPAVNSNPSTGCGSDSSSNKSKPGIKGKPLNFGANVATLPKQPANR